MLRSKEGQRSSRKMNSPWLQSPGRLRLPAWPSVRDSIRGFDGRVPATKHTEPVGLLCMKDEVVGPRNALEMKVLHLAGVRRMVEGEVGPNLVGAPDEDDEHDDEENDDSPTCDFPEFLGW